MKFTCEICREAKFKNNLCVHRFCWECISTYIETKVLDNAANIPCPDTKCDKLFDPINARAILPPKVFDRWCDNLCESALLGLKTCYCPYEDCSTLVVDECSGRTRLKETKCPNCKRLFCFSCRFRWRPGHRCADIQNLRDENDRKFLELVQEKAWTSCPKCRHPVDRIGGCVSIHCRCGITFCHKCGRKDFCKCIIYYASPSEKFLMFLVVLLPIAFVLYITVQSTSI